jgi:N-acyl-D-amino-acid deacylase
LSWRGALGGVAILLCAACTPSQRLASQEAAGPHDLVLANARVVDGTGNPWFRADVAIRGDTIVHVAPRITHPARRTIDVRGQVVAPGFIDLHTHARGGIERRPTADNFVRQGVTTIFEGADGSSAVPLKPFLEQVQAWQPSLNVASFVGHGSVRGAVMGQVDRAATPEELDRMRVLVDRDMRDGAFGLSTGLFYVPGTYALIEEPIELAKVAGRHGGMHNSHMRSEGNTLLDSVAETIRIGEEGGLPTHISHHKSAGRANWGKTRDSLAAVDAARARGVDITLDVYPYAASATSLQSNLLPAWALEGGRLGLEKRLGDPAERARLVDAATVLMKRRGPTGGDDIRIASCVGNPSVAGRSLAQLAGSPDPRATAQAGLALLDKGFCSAIFFSMDEADVERVIRHPASMIASDGGIPIPGEGVPHPRSYGTFARVLAVYVREKGMLSLEEAVRKMTSFPAQRVGITDRGVIRPGMKADIAVFDPARVRDLATYEQPHQYAEGFSAVLVNGVMVYEGGKMTDARPGRVLFGPAKK